MGAVLLIIGILLTGNILAVMIMTGFELGAAASLIISVLLIIWGANYKKIKESRGIIRFFKAIFKLGLIYIIAASCFLAVFGSVSGCKYNEEYVIVLGCGIRNSQPTNMLRYRLDKAVEYAVKNPDATIIVSGGQGRDENVSEASVMYSYLTENGVSPSRILTEENSHSTYENFKFTVNSYNLQGKRAAVITNRFHMFRANMYAKLSGITPLSCPAGASIYLLPVSYIRETIALLKTVSYYIPINFRF